MFRPTLSIILALAPIAIALPAQSEGIDVPATVRNGPAAESMHVYMERLTDFGFNGTVLVAQGDEIVFHEAYGVADPRSGRANTTSTLFSTGSVTKQFTAAAVVKLAIEGKLSFDDPLSKHIAGVPEDKQAITLHHLLTHTAGLHPSYGPDRESVARDALVRRIFEEPLMNPVGETYEYSNAGFTLLAVIVEDLTGTPYETYLRENLYLPNRMLNTGLTSLEVSDDQVARAHNPSRDYQSPADRPPDAWNLYGNGGLLSTTSDMYRWYRALHDDLLFPRAYRDTMYTRYAAEGPEGRCHYGYGWSICDTRRGGDVVWHNGGAMGLWSCAIYQYVNDDAVFIVFANSTMEGRGPVDDIAVGLSRILFGEPYDLPPDLSASPDVDPTPFAGTYELSGGGSITVAADGNSVSIAPNGQSAMMAVFPSQMNPMLPKYNAKTETMVAALESGDYERAGADVEMEKSAEQTGGEWLREWWESLDGAAALERIEVVGTKFGGSAETYVRLHFAEGAQDFCFYWMMGRCHGIAVSQPPSRTLHAATPTSFTSFSFQGGGIEADFSNEGTLILRIGDETLEGKRGS